MRQRRLTTLIACAALALGILFPGAASASPVDTKTVKPATQSEVDSAMVENFGVSSEKMFVMDSSTAVEVEDGIFYPMPSEAEDALRITPELAADLGLEAGEVPHNMTYSVAQELLDINLTAASQNSRETSTSAETSALASCATGFYTPPGYGWSSWGNRACSQIGNSVGRQVYFFQVNVNSDGRSCGEGTGFVANYSGGTFTGTTKKYYGLGCGSSGGANVPWEMVAGYPQFKSKSAYLGLGAYGTWT
ncbi:hypothetical protein ACTXJU_16470 [Glutamicibacter ardleyensis]|uniref:hypothetical protein n=1 Tax=Glutamicibacter ardleyensis TaxID=225894 RepID=UPI003FB7E022